MNAPLLVNAMTKDMRWPKSVPCQIRYGRSDATRSTHPLLRVIFKTRHLDTPSFGYWLSFSNMLKNNIYIISILRFITKIFWMINFSGQKLFILHMLVLPLIPITALVIQNSVALNTLLVYQSRVGTIRNQVIELVNLSGILIISWKKTKMLNN